MKPIADIKQIAVIGSGVIGASWSALFLSQGLDVTATDINPRAEDGLREVVAKAWPDLQALGLVQPGRSGTLRFEVDLIKALAGADFVQENAIEREGEKVELLAQIDAIVRPDVIIASSSSAITITAMQRKCKFPGRVVLGHPFNPPHLIPLVEVAGGELTDAEALTSAEAFYQRLGKSTIRLNKEIYGHVANRLQGAVFREAIYLLKSGVASLSDIDKAMTDGPGLRWALMGPFLTYHLAGGTGGMEAFMNKFAPMQKKLWAELGTPDISQEEQVLVSNAMDAAVGTKPVAAFAMERDRSLLSLLVARHKIPTRSA